MENTIARFKVIKEDIIGNIDIPKVDYNLIKSVILSKDNKMIGNHVIDLLNMIFSEENDRVINERLEKLGFSSTSIMHA